MRENKVFWHLCRPLCTFPSSRSSCSVSLPGRLLPNLTQPLCARTARILLRGGAGIACVLFQRQLAP